MTNGKYRIGISGSYGGLNLGDEAILESIVSQLRDSLDVEITVFTRDTEDTLRRHDVERAVAARMMSREEVRVEIERLDTFVLGGGGILYDGEAETYLREVQIAHEIGIPVFVYAISAGPLNDPNARHLVAEGLNRAAVVTVRDRLGQHLLEEVGVERPIVVTADPAVLLEPSDLPEEALKREGLDESKRLVGFSVREPGGAAPDMDVEHYHGLLANAADFMVDRYDADVVFIPMERKKLDMQHCHAVVAQMQNAQRAMVVRGEYTSREMLALIGHFELAVGMRLHFLIFAAHQGVPFVALPYASKVTGLLEFLDIPAPPLKSVNAGRLIASIDHTWDWRERVRTRISEKFPEMKARARHTNDLLVRLIKGEALDDVQQSQP